MYIEASYQIPGDTARLYVGPINNSISDMCLEFWYHMLGISQGDLTVSTRLTGTTGSGLVLWKKSGLFYFQYMHVFF